VLVSALRMDEGDPFLLTSKEGNCNPKTKPMPLRRTFSASWAEV
jgi:hypothetical protein